MSDVPDSHPFHGASGLLRQVGDTPLVRLRSLDDLIPKGVEIWGKCEWFNPGGSVKARPALSMVLDAERRGVLRPGMTLLDASSGNTGIALGIVAAVRGYELTLCLPKNANEERKQLLAAYGVNVVYTDPLEGSDGAIRQARQLAAEHPDLVYVDQYNNDANWRSHFGSTGPEIVAQTQGRVTHFVSVLGTSGTFTGVGRYLKQWKHQTHITEVQPDSPFHGLEGLKFMETAIVPGIYDPAMADAKLGAPTEPAFQIVRKLAAEEGVLVGPSAAAAVWASIETARSLEHGVIVTILCDSGERYLSEPHIWGER